MLMGNRTNITSHDISPMGAVSCERNHSNAFNSRYNSKEHRNASSLDRIVRSSFQHQRRCLPGVQYSCQRCCNIGLSASCWTCYPVF